MRYHVDLASDQLGRITGTVESHEPTHDPRSVISGFLDSVDPKALDALMTFDATPAESVLKALKDLVRARA